MTEWTDPRYADLVEAIRREQRPQGDPDRTGRPRPARGFVIPAPDET